MKDDKEYVTIIELHKKGTKKTEIGKTTGYGKMKVKKAVDRFFWNSRIVLEQVVQPQPSHRKI